MIWQITLLSPTLILTVAGVTTFTVISGAHYLLSQTLTNLQNAKKNLKKSQKYMKAVVLRSYGGLKSIQIVRDLPVPEIADEDQVLIKVVAAGLDRMDLKVAWGYARSIRNLLRRNSKHLDQDAPIVLGRECSGIVLDIGNEVHSLNKGDAVWVIATHYQEGLMAEYVVVKESQVAKKPEKLTFEEAASIPYSAMFMWNALNEAGLDPASTKDKRILVHSGNSPSGLFAIQLLKSWQGHVTTTVPTAGLPMCHELDADDAVVYSVTDFEAELRFKKKFDVIINTFGTIVHQFCVDICAPGGKVVTMVTTPILTDKFGLFTGSLLTFLLQLSSWLKKIKYSTVTEFSWKYFDLGKETLEKITMMVENTKVRPIIEAVYEMDEALLAFQQLAVYDNVGKSVLRISQQRCLVLT